MKTGGHFRPWGLAAFAACALVIAALAAAGALGWLNGPLTLHLEARPSPDGRFAFSPAELTAPQHGSIVVEFDNPTSAPHTLVFLEPIDRRSGVIVDPGGHDRLAFTTPGPGSYGFVCTVHEDMAGVLIVR